MAEYSIQDTTLTGMADQIRTMHGTTDAMAPSTMITKLQDANEEISGQEALLVEIANTLQTKAIGTPPKLQSKTVTPSASSQTVAADSGYDGLSLVTVNGSENLVAENIAKDVEIFGIIGTHAGGRGAETCTVNVSGPVAVYVYETLDDSNNIIVNRQTVDSYFNSPIIQKVICNSILILKPYGANIIDESSMVNAVPYHYLESNAVCCQITAPPNGNAHIVLKSDGQGGISGGGAGN